MPEITIKHANERVIGLGTDAVEAARQAGIATSEAQEAAVSAAFAEEFSGPAYADVAAGEAATTDGQFFRVPNGTTPETYTRYQRTAAGSVEAAALATTMDLASTASGKGSELVAYKADVTGAVDRTVKAKLDDRLSVTDWPGVVADGTTDNTAAILDFWTALGSTWAGTVYVPQNVKFDFSTVADAAPLRANIIDDSGINGWNTSGFRQKIVGAWESGDATSVTDLNFVVSSGHNSVVVLENRGTAGSTSADGRVAGVMWSAGRFQQGEPGIRSLSRLVWSEDSNDATKWSLALRKMASWAARDYEKWAAGRTFGAGDYTITQAGRTYTTGAGGTAGATEPTHISGTVSDGGIDWTYVETAQDATIMKITELGRVAYNTSLGTNDCFKWKQNTSDTGNVSVTFEGTGASRAVTLFLNGTNGSGVVNSSTPYIQGTTSGTLRIVGGGNILAEFSSDNLKLGAVSSRSSTLTANDPTPSVLNLREVVFNNGAATNVTTFDDGAATHELFCLFLDGITTLVNGATLRLKGGVNVTPAAGSTMTFKKFAASSAWYEVARNF